MKKSLLRLWLITIVYFLSIHINIYADNHTEVFVDGEAVAEFVSHGGVRYFVNYPFKEAWLCNFIDGFNFEDFEIPKEIVGCSVRHVDSEAFINHTELKSITIPAIVDCIGNDAFNGCTGLKKVVFSDAEATIELGTRGDNYYTMKGLFYDCPIEELYMGRNLKYVYHVDGYSSPFKGQITLKSLTFGDDVTEISDWLFNGCTSLTKVTFPDNLITIGAHAFCACTGLTSIVIPDNVTTIGYYAFGDTGLTSLTIGNGVTSIGSYAFSNCIGLTSITIPDNVINVYDNAFFCCTGLISACIGNGVVTIERETFLGCNNLTSISIGSGVKFIDSDAFRACVALTKAEFASVESFCNIRFGYYGNANPLEFAHHLYVNGNEVKDLVIPDGVTSLDNRFSGCVGLTSVSIPGSVTEIGKDAFSGCSGLTSATIGNGVTKIGEFAFSYCTSLTSVSIPNSVTSIGSAAFQYCNSLESVNLPNGLTEISTNIFLNCSALTSVSIPNSVTSIGWAAFMNCSALTSVTVPNGVTSIGQQAFKGCSNLSSITIPNSVVSIRARALYGTAWLNNQPDGVVYAGKVAYTYKGAMPENTRIVLDSSTLGIAEEAFVERENLNSVVIGNQVSSIGGLAFGYCYFLSNVYCFVENGIPGADAVNSIFHGNHLEYDTLHVPESVIETYKSTYPWSQFGTIVALTDEDANMFKSFTLTYKVDGGVYKTSTVLYGTPLTPEAEPTKEGYTFSGWSEIPKTMPAHDVTITGTFSINSYKMTYIVDGKEYKSLNIEYGTTITPEEAPEKEGYTFSGWSEIPETMPAHDVTITGTFTINKYLLTYMVDDEVFKSDSIVFNTVITPESEPTKEGYTFSGWSEIPETMPAHDVTITGLFLINSYKLTYMIDDTIYKEVTYEYGATITPEPMPKGDYATFEWLYLPETMPAHDVVVHASYTTGIRAMILSKPQDVQIYSPNGKKLNKLQKGLNIVIMRDGTIRKIVIK